MPSLSALKGAARHSRIVRTMRLILPALALLVTGVVLLQAFMYRADDSLKLSFAKGHKGAEGAGVPKMVAPEFSAQFGGNPFRITAKSAYRDPDRPERVMLDKLQGDVSPQKGGWLSLVAAKGVLDTKTLHVTLGPGLDLFSDMGYELHSRGADVDLRNGRVTSRKKVRAQGPIGALQADGFSISNEGATVQFNGNVRMKLRPSRR